MSPSVPVHVTLKLMRGLWNLRSKKPFAMILDQIQRAARPGLRITCFSVQHDHVHFLVEASNTRSLSTGIQGLSVRIAHHLNRLMRRAGSVFKDRYHARLLRTPREVRNALVYLANNGRKHLEQIGRKVARGWLDPCANIAALAAWCPELALFEKTAPPVVRPESWLLRHGYLKAGCIRLAEISTA